MGAKHSVDGRGGWRYEYGAGVGRGAVVQHKQQQPMPLKRYCTAATSSTTCRSVRAKSTIILIVSFCVRATQTVPHVKKSFQAVGVTAEPCVL